MCSQILNEKKSRILVVEDSPLNLKTLEKILPLHIDCYLCCVTTGKQALEAADEFAPDLILLDVMLPDMNGLKICRLLRLKPATAEIPVLFLTAKTDVEDIVSGFEAGAADYITKPFNELELVARVKTHLKLHEASVVITRQNRELREALDQIKTLRGLVPICANCKKIRDDKGFWQEIEVYVRNNTEAVFSHGICPVCAKKLYPGICDDIDTQGVS